MWCSTNKIEKDVGMELCKFNVCVFLHLVCLLSCTSIPIHILMLVFGKIWRI